MLILSGM